jgi:beta-fructofuranosidase
MKYRGIETNMWDAWFININGRVHAFHLQLPGSGNSLPEDEKHAVGHIYSDDLIHWTRCPSILYPLNEIDEKDYQQKFTGCAAEIEGKYLIFYTMRDKERGNQRIGVAISHDMVSFELYTNNPVIEPDDKLLIGYETIKNYDWDIVDCRDLITVKCDLDGLYYGYFAAAADVGRSHPVGVIAVAISDDLLNWRDQSIAYVPKQNGVVEVPDVYELDGKWYMTMLCGTRYLGRSCCNDDYSISCTTYAVAKNPRGPFFDPEDNILLSGGILSCGFTCRSVVKDGRRYLFYVDGSYGGSTLSLPKEIKVNANGELGAYYADILKGCRVNTLISSDTMPDINNNMMITTSAWWRTFGGEWQKRDHQYKCITNEYDYQAINFDVGSTSIEAEAGFTINSFAAGFYICTKNEKTTLAYIASIEPSKERLLLAKMPTFEYLNACKFKFLKNIKYVMKLLMLEGICEIYINGKLIMQCGIELLQKTNIGLFCDRGEVIVENLVLYELESD